MGENKFSGHIEKNKKRANGFTLIELLVSVALFVSYTVFLMQAFSLGYASIAGLDATNLAYYLTERKLEQIRSTSYPNVVSESRIAITGYSGYDGQVDVSLPKSPNKDLKKVVVTVYYSQSGGERNVALKTLVANK